MTLDPGAISAASAGADSPAALDAAAVPDANAAAPAPAAGVVVVGVDGSACALTATRWAAAQARLSGALVRVVTVRAPAADWPHDTPEHAARLERKLRAQTDAILDAARAEIPAGQAADYQVIIGNPAFSLLDMSAEPAVGLLVVGSRGLGGLRGTLSGSTVAQLAGHTGCPLVVVRDLPDQPNGKVVVGIDGRANSAAVDFAFAHAALIDATVRAVWCWTGGAAGSTDPDLIPDEDWQHTYERAIQTVLSPLRQRYPAVPVEEVVVRGQPARVLADQARGADLLVVGSRGRGGFATLVMGSVALSVLHDVARPVAIVPRPPDGT